MHCARHPKVETALTCTRCTTPICPACMVSGAVGFLCPDCAARGKSPEYQVHPARFVLALFVGIACGFVAGVLLRQIQILVVLLAPVIGGLLGEIVRRATGRKRGAKVEWLTGGSIAVGALLSLLLTGWQILLVPTALIFFLAAVGAVTAFAVFRIRQ